MILIVKYILYLSFVASGRQTQLAKFCGERLNTCGNYRIKCFPHAFLSALRAMTKAQNFPQCHQTHVHPPLFEVNKLRWRTTTTTPNQGKKLILSKIRFLWYLDLNFTVREVSFRGGERAIATCLQVRVHERSSSACECSSRLNSLYTMSSSQ